MKLTTTFTVMTAALLLIAGEASAQGRSREHRRDGRVRAANAQVHRDRNARVEDDEDSDEDEGRGVIDGRRRGGDDDEDSDEDSDRNESRQSRSRAGNTCVDINGDGICDIRQGGSSTSRTGTRTSRRGSTRGSARDRVIYGGLPGTGTGQIVQQIGATLLQRLFSGGR